MYSIVLHLVTFLTFLYIYDPAVAVPTVTLSPGTTAYVNNGSLLTLTCGVNEDVGTYFVYFSKNGIDHIFIYDVPNCASDILINNETNAFNVSCNGLRSFTMLQKTVSVGDHNAKWRCFLTPSGGTGPCAKPPNPCMSLDVTIFVRVPVTRVKLTDETDNSLSSPVAVAVGTSPNFRCNTSPNGSRPRAIFHWYKRLENQSNMLIENQFISSTPEPVKVPEQTWQDLVISYSTLTLTGNRSFQNMYIFCAAQNEANSGPEILSAEIQLNIMYPPVVSLNPNNSVYNVTEGKENFLLMCDVIDANPQPQANAFIWRHQGTVLQGQTFASYVIQSIRKSDKGQYQCSASNPYGTGSSNIMDLSVQYGAGIIKVSVVDGNTVNENGTAIITCQVDSNPESNITWTMQGDMGALHTDIYVHQSQLIINYANCLDTGNYTCAASNGLGSPTEKQTPLYVNCHPRPDNRLLPKTRVYGKQYGNASLSYTVISFPEPTFNWIFIGNGSENRQLPDSAKVHSDGLQSVLMFRNLSITDFGFYSVTAANSFLPSSTQVFQLIQADAPKILGVSPDYEGYVGQFIMIQFDFYSDMKENLTVTAQHSNASGLINQGIIQPTLPHALGDSPPVQAPNFRATLVICITSKNDFGQYELKVKNSIGSDSKSVRIVEQIIPEKPINFHATNIQEKQLSLMWQSGYNGGLTQTFVVELSLDNITWNNASQVNAGNRDGWFSTIVGNLIPGSEYYLRLYAYTVNGRGDFADVLLVIRMLKECACASSLEVSPSVGISVGGVVGVGVGGAVLGLIGTIIAFTIRRQLNGPKISCFRSKGKTDDAMHTYSNNEMIPESVKPIYEELNKGNVEQTVYDKISPL